MRDDDDAALEGDEQFFEPGDGLQVEVVGGLVEQQHVGARDQGLRERDTLLDAARQIADAGGAVKAQPGECFGHALLAVPAVLRLDLGLQGVQVLARGMREVTLHQRRDA